eukprot:TRINITY_DN4170_c0_g1_i1.p3 TRINITY_DN4170_c0_g1~~TRINITY_DN4170_c0_g1_i1.p3  ORF type:complete len:123 (-),score=17.06 TRINITY_DN4170_c0_g1_i1:158-526(-)
MTSFTQLKSIKALPLYSLKYSTPRSIQTRSRQSTKIRAEFFGSPANLIVCGCTALFLVAGRFGIAPTANKLATTGLKLQDNKSGLISGDPSGFTAVDVLYLGTAGHAVAIGIVLGLKGIGAI